MYCQNCGFKNEEGSAFCGSCGTRLNIKTTIVYPNENVKVYNEIAKNGLIVSEYIVGTKPDAWRFPARNRIVSGLSKGVVVVEAKKKSGTLITVDFALEQGREVFVVPRKYKFSKFRRDK